MRANFTPGPWEVGQDDKNGQAIVRSTFIEVATCWHHCVGSIEKEMRANATLIAAAPELFDAVDMLVKSFNASGIAADCDSNDPAEVLMCKAMRAWLKAGAV